MSCHRSRSRQQGAALVIALLIFALAAALMVGVQRDFSLQLQRSTNTFFAEQGWAFLVGAEELGILALSFDSELDAQNEVKVDSLNEAWAQPPQPYPLDEIGVLIGALYDLQGRFNLNGLVENPGEGRRSGTTPSNDGGEAGTADQTEADNPPAAPGQPRARLNEQQRILARLMLAIPELELDLTEAVRLVERITDFIDADSERRLDGAENEIYLSGDFPYRPANRALASVSELRAVAGMTPERYTLLAPFLSVWPKEGSEINVLTAPPQVLAALGRDDSLSPLSANEVGRILEMRDADMIPDTQTFLEDPAFANSEGSGLSNIITVQSQWFLLDARVEIADRERRLYSVLHREGRRIAVVHRTEGEL